MHDLKDLSSEILSIQQEYLTLVERSSVALDLNYFSSHECRCFIDDVRGFWLERKEIVRYCWDKISDVADCFILSAAINLKVEFNNHYPFKAVGDFQLLHDPFIKMERFYRVPEGSINSEEVQKEFRHVVEDTLMILKSHSSDFFFLDMSIMRLELEADKFKTIRKGYDNFLSNLFKGKETEDLPNLLSTYSDIENNIDPNIVQLLIFNDSSDHDLPLGERVERFISKQRNLSHSSVSDNECEKFLLAFWCLYCQAADTILSCLAAGFYPYFRSEVPAKYFYLLFKCYENDEAVLEFIWKSISAYFLGQGMEQIGVDAVEFARYRDYLSSEKPYKALINALDFDVEKLKSYRIEEISKTVKPIVEKVQKDLGL